MYQFGPFSLDCAEHRLLRDGIEIALQPRVFATLRVLVENAGCLLKKDELLQRVWPDTIVEENNLNKNISLLRKALGERAGAASCIETIPRIGYRFIEPVFEIPAQVCLGDCTTTEPCEFEQSVAVLYFQNLSGGKENEYFRDGMAEDVITELARIKTLRVLPRSAVFEFRDQQHSAIEVGEKLCASYVLEGSVRRLGKYLRITAHLADIRNGHCIWAESYDRQLENNFETQDGIAQDIARALELQLTGKQKRDSNNRPAGMHAAAC